MKPVSRLLKPLLVFFSTALFLLLIHWLLVKYVASSSFTGNLLVLHLSMFLLYGLGYSVLFILYKLFREYRVWVILAAIMVKMFLALVMFLIFYMVKSPLTIHFAIVFVVLYLCYLIPFIFLSVKYIIIESPKK